MRAANEAISRTINYFSTIGAADIIDILLIAYLVYRIIALIRRTNLYNLAKGLAIFIIALWLSDLCRLNMTNFILRKAAELGLIALVVLFQPELRRLLERVGSTFMHSSGKSINVSQVETAIAQTAEACGDMSASKTGALIVFERKVRLNDVIATGTPIDSEVSAELLKNMFFNKAPLHDGAVIIRNGRVAAAGCVLPLTNSTNLSKELGMRHRAGIGMSEQSDAIVLIVSEETGAISCTIDGSLKRHLNMDMVVRILREGLIEDSSSKKSGNIVLRLISSVTDSAAALLNSIGTDDEENKK